MDRMKEREQQKEDDLLVQARESTRAIQSMKENV